MIEIYNLRSIQTNFNIMKWFYTWKPYFSSLVPVRVYSSRIIRNKGFKQAHRVLVLVFHLLNNNFPSIEALQNSFHFHYKIASSVVNTSRSHPSAFYLFVVVVNNVTCGSLFRGFYSLHTSSIFPSSDPRE